MDGDELAERAGVQREERCRAGRLGEPPGHVAHAIEELRARGLAPADVEASEQRREPHAPVGGVAADVEEDERVADRLQPLAQRHVAVGDLAVGDADLGREVLRAQHDAAQAGDRADAAHDLQQPAEVRRQPAVGDHELLRGGEVDAARHRRPDVRARPRDLGLLRIDRERQRVAIAGEARAERRRQPRQPLAVLQQQPARSERAGGEDEHRRAHLAVGRVLQVAEADRPRAALAGRRIDAQDLVQREDLGAMLLGARDIRDVDGVLRHPRAADVAAAEVVAALLKRAAERVAPVLAEVHRDRQALGGQARVRRHRVERADLRQRGLGRGRAGVERRLGAVVVRPQRVRVDRRGPGRIVEDVVGRAQLDVRVDERPAADAGAGHDRDVAHDPQVEQPAGVVARVPEHPRRLLGAVGIVAGPEAAPALQDAHAPARLREPARGDPAAEPGADDHRVVGGLHRLTLTALHELHSKTRHTSEQPAPSR